MRRGSTPILNLLAVAAISLGAAPPKGDAALPPKGETRSRAPVHPDPAALEQALLDAVRALVRDDPVAARTALDRVEKGCRRLGQDEIPSFSSDLVEYDAAVHLTIDRTREFSARGDLDRAQEQTWWLQKGCRKCHEIARKDGLMAPPPTGTRRE